MGEIVPVFGPFLRKIAAFGMAAILLVAGGLFPPSAGHAQVAPLHYVKEVRSLSPEAAAQAKPIVLRGVVTAISGWKSSFFMQDATAGISIDRDFAEPSVKQGQLVEVQGVTGPGRFAPVIKATKVTVMGSAALPSAKNLSYAELFSGNEDGQWIGLTGLVRSAELKQLWGQPRLVLTLDTGGGAIITARVHDFDPGAIARYAGAIVSIRGVCGTVFNDRRQFVGARVFVAGTQDIRIDTPPTSDPFSFPLRDFNSLMQFRDNQKFHPRVRVRGIVTWSQTGNGSYLMNGDQGLFVDTGANALPVGSSVEAVGYPAVGQYSPQLENALVRPVQADALVNAKQHTASELIVIKEGFASAPFDASLVTLKGRLVEEVPNGKDELLLMQDGDTFFTAKMARAKTGHVHFDDDSILQLTGVCVAAANQWRDAQTFSLLLRDKSDIVVLKNPPWWNARHATWVFSLSSLAIVAVFVVLGIVRHNKYLHELAVTDSLTGLYNRRGFMLLAQQQWQTMQRQRGKMLLFYIDLDRFKEINDTHGHQEGDKALQSVTALLRNTFRKSDIIGRMGGDEFSVATIADSEAAGLAVQDRLWEAVRSLNQAHAHPYELKLSVGTISCDASSGYQSMEELISMADAEMYKKKRSSDAASRAIRIEKPSSPLQQAHRGA